MDRLIVQEDGISESTLPKESVRVIVPSTSVWRTLSAEAVLRSLVNARGNNTILKLDKLHICVRRRSKTRKYRVNQKRRNTTNFPIAKFTSHLNHFKLSHVLHNPHTQTHIAIIIAVIYYI